MNDEKNAPSAFRIGLVFLAALALVGLVAGILVWSPWESEENNEPEFTSDPLPLSLSDREDLQTKMDEVLDASGNFGLDASNLTNNNIQQIGYTVARQDAGWADYFVARSFAFEDAKAFIQRKSPIDQTQSEISQWNLGNELENLKTFELDDTDFTVPEEGTSERRGSGEEEFVRIPAEFSSRVTQRFVTAEDTSWDGSYRILEKDIEGSATFVFHKFGGEWLLYDIETPKNLFLLALTSPDFGSEYNEEMFDFREIEIVTPDQPYTLENEDTNG